MNVWAPRTPDRVPLPSSDETLSRGGGRRYSQGRRVDTIQGGRRYAGSSPSNVWTTSTEDTRPGAVTVI
eukprot:632354-Pyramimonas_sp.AAC.2